MDKPVNTRYYRPQEPIKRYPLELTDNHHICLWSEDGKYKWTIALFDFGKEGPDCRFIGDRPFNERVNWAHFEELLRHGQLLADNHYYKNLDSD